MSKHRRQRKGWLTPVGGAACHAGAVPVFTDPVSGLVFKGGGLHRELVLRDELVITAVSDPSVVKVSGISAAGLEDYMNPSISLEWDDGLGFQLKKDFWYALLAKIRGQKRDVLCMCFGGHGRTGTMLSIFAALTGATKGDPVQFVRDHYCKEAVETATQIRYIEEVTGRKIEAEESRKPVAVAGFHSLTDWYTWRDRQDDDKLPGWSEVKDEEKGE